MTGFRALVAFGVATATGLVALGIFVPSVVDAAKVRNGLIAYTTGNGDYYPFTIWTIRPDGTASRRLLGADDRYQAGPSGPRWSRDGKWLLFRRTLSRGDSSGGDSLWYMTATGRHLRRIPLPTGGLQGYDWAPDGRRVVVSMMANFKAMLYTMRLDGTHRRALRPGYDPSWAGDGRHIVFTLMRRRYAEPWASTINVVRPDGTGFKRLSPPGSNDDWSPSISPGGSRIVFDNHAEGARSWGMVDVTGSSYRLWPKPSLQGGRFLYPCPPRWTPDGARLAVVRHEDLPNKDETKRALVTFSRAGQDERVEFSFPPKAGGLGYGCMDVAWQRVPTH